MRVAIDARTIVPRKSGIGNYVDALVRELLTLDDSLELTLLCHPQSRGLVVEHPRAERVIFPGETKSLSTVFRMGGALAGRGIELYHSPADLVPLGLRLPWVVTLHDLMWVEQPALASAFLPERWANAAWYRWNIGRAVRGARRVITITEATRTAAARVYPAAASKLRTIRHGVDHQRYYPGAGGPRAALAGLVPDGKRYSLIVGQGSPYKNHAGMVRAFLEATADEPEHLLVLVRRFSRIDTEMSRLLSSRRARDKLITIPFVSDAALLTLYAHAHALLFASHLEGFGMPALEALALGTPVLASTTPALREVTGQAALHAVSTDHADLVRQLRRLSKDEALREQLRRRGLEQAQQFQWRRAAEHTLACYREALAQAPG